MSNVCETVVDGNTDPAGAADALDLSFGEVYEALADYYNNPEEMRTPRAAQAEAREELRNRAVKPPVESDSSRWAGAACSQTNTFQGRVSQFSALSAGGRARKQRLYGPAPNTRA